jgi:hypothetical protein
MELTEKPGAAAMVVEAAEAQVPALMILAILYKVGREELAAEAGAEEPTNLARRLR